MPEVTYDELVRVVPLQLYAENTVLIDEMPTIIRQAEDLLLQVVDHDLYQTILDPVVLSVGENMVDLRSVTPRVLEVRSITVQTTGGEQSLERRNLEFLRALFPVHAAGFPIYYAEKGDINLLQIFPTPFAGVTLEIMANVEVERLSSTQQTNKLTQEYPRAVEKACFYQACVFMKAFDQAQTYQAEMTQAVSEASMALARRRRDETGTRPVETSNATGS